MLRKPSTALPGCCGRRLRSPILGTLAAVCLLATPASPAAAQIGVTLTDDTLTPVDELYVGETLYVGLEGLEPDRSYQVQLLDGEGFMVSYYQLTTDADGTIEPAPIWYHTGVVGCDETTAVPDDPYRFVSFEEAEAALGGLTFEIWLFDLETPEPLAGVTVPLVVSTRPRIYFSDATGCLRNSFRADEDDSGQDVYLTAENLLADGSEVAVYLVPNRYAWPVAAALEEVRPSYADSPQRIAVDHATGSIHELVWPAAELVPGAYDAVVRLEPQLDQPVLVPSDLVTYRIDTGVVVHQLATPCPSGTDFDIAGRPDKSWGYPYFEFHDVFEQGEEMWGAVDPVVVPSGHPGGTYAAFYVIAAGSAGSGLVDVTEGLEIVRVKSGCINGAMTRIWNVAGQIGEYDVVVDFGATPASSLAAWVADNTFNQGLDFIDRASMTGAWVIADPAVPGPYTVLSWQYAPAAAPPDPLYTDITQYYSPGGGTNLVPLHGEVRYPSGSGPFPLVLIVHGNASPSQPSEQGYFYLLDLLASHGIIAVSVDENFLNGGVWGEMDARGIVLLRHLQRWREWSTTPGHLFYNKVNMSLIGLAGHSRGGEAVTVASLFNTTLHNPGDPDHDFDFSLSGLYAIAPVDGQIGTSYPGTPIVLDGDHYFIMHGSHDGDVYDFQGQRTYDRAEPVTGGGHAWKALLWVHGANHTYWNTIWAPGGDPSTVQPAGDLISAADQQAIGKVYVSAFFQDRLLGRTSYRALMTGDVTFNTLPPAVTLVHQYQDDNRLFLNHYEEDDVLATGSLAGVTNTNPGSLLNPYLDYAFSDTGPPYHLWQQTDGLIAGWTSTSAEYVVDLPAFVGSIICNYPYLAFRVAQTYEVTPSFNTPGQDQDFSVQLELTSGPVNTLKVSNFDTLPYPDYTLRGWDISKTVMKTVRLPLRAFMVNRVGMDLDDITTIRLRFNRRSSGLIAFDDLQLTH